MTEDSVAAVNPALRTRQTTGSPASHIGNHETRAAPNPDFL